MKSLFFFLGMLQERGLKGMAMTGHVSTFTLQSTFLESIELHDDALIL